MPKRWVCLNSIVNVTTIAKAIETRLGYRFTNHNLLKRAFTHRSASAEHNERLEFLGDAVLDLVVSHNLFDLYPDVDEGDLSRMRSWLVKKESLYEIGETYQLAEHIEMGDGETRSGGKQRKSTIADTVEALIAAVYLDGGFEQSKKFVEKMFAQRMESLPDIQALKDSKSRLQEYLQFHRMPLPEYKLVDEKGKPHAKIFTVSCTIDKPDITEYAEAASRRKAEQLAAQKVLDYIYKKSQ